MEGKDKKDFFEGTGDFDSADFRVAQNDWVNMENCRTGSTDKGVIGTVESIASTVLLSTPQPSITFVQIGSVADDTNRRIIYFLKDLHGPFDKIVCYDLSNNVFYNVLLGSQVLGGLNLNKDYLIHSARIVNGLLYWTDNLNQPRRINVNAGINLNHPGTFSDVVPYTVPINAEVITIARKPPNYILLLQKIVDPTINSNQIGNNAFRFTYFYTYRDGERSTLAPHSLLANYNYKEDEFNAIDITIPIIEEPYQDVQIINLVVIYVAGGTGFIIKTWNKANPVEAAQIADHVADIAALSFRFSNDAVGEAIDSATLVKPFDSIPLLSETLEQAVNRLFLGRNLIGYDTPVSTSLTAQVESSEGTTFIGNYWAQSVTYSPLGCNDWYWYFIYTPVPLDGTHPAGYYDVKPTRLNSYGNNCVPVTLPPMPIDIDDLWFVGTTKLEITDYIDTYDDARTGGPIVSRTFNALIEDPFHQWVVTTTEINPNTSILKSDSSYRLGIVFYDQYLRQCGVVVGPKVTTPDREYNDAISLLYGVRWTLPAGPQTEIPAFARYYSVVMTKSLRTSFFMQARAGDLAYATKDSNGNYVFTEQTYSDSNAGVAVKLDLLNGAGMGYSFTEGDIIKLYFSGGNKFIMAVIAQSGEWVIGELKDVGVTTGLTPIFEIYTPTPQAAAQFYYEIAAMYFILDPDTTARRYSTLTGVLPGDVYLLEIGTSPDQYLVETMSPNLTYWRNWFTNAGRIQVVDSIGQRYKDTSVKWSNTFIPGTLTNGLSSFDALDEKILPGELGPLRKLQTTSKVNNELGVVMLAICELETSSMYLGESQLVGSTGNAFIAQSTGVIGTVNTLKGSFGTINPESVTWFKGYVFWYDAYGGKIIQYSANGLFPISEYKMTRFWKLFSDQYLSMSKQDIENLGSRPFIFMTVDPYHWELLVTVPRVLTDPPKGYLPDIPSMIYPWDIYDGQAKTLVYKLKKEPNYWQGSVKGYVGEGWVTIENKLFSFKNGYLYKHNNPDSGFGKFYGIQYKSRIMYVSNQFPRRPKVYNNKTVDANMVPQLTYFYSEVPYQQASDLIDTDYNNLEGILYATIYKNKLAPTAAGFTSNGLLTGEKMRAIVLKVLLEFIVSDTPLELRYTELGFEISSGHTTT